MRRTIVFAVAWLVLAPLQATAQKPPVLKEMHVDQFGYRPLDRKVAVLADPQIGHNARRSYQPHRNIQVRRWADDSIVMKIKPTPWNNGRLHEQSGDRGWWVDFSALTTSGDYYLYDGKKQQRSDRFRISNDVYDDVLVAALRVFYFNRGNVAHTSPYAEQWLDQAAHVGPGQDTEARYVNARNDESQIRDMSGGWFDAGDTNKYVTFAADTVHQLLAAYQDYPEVFTDDTNIPESGNGLPDILDEVLWEMDWLERMQDDDGGVFLKLGDLEYFEFQLPSTITTPRYYEQKCSSAAIAAAAMFAHMGVVLQNENLLAGDVADYRARAIAAWDWYVDSPIQTNCDDGTVKAGDADWSRSRQHQQQVVAAVYLFALTGEQRFQEVIARRLDDTRLFTDVGMLWYVPSQTEALTFYTTLANRDSATSDAILARLDLVGRSSALLGFAKNADLYRAYLPDEQHHWGSSTVRANVGASNMLLVKMGINPQKRNRYTQRGGTHLQYFHGVNPLGLVYLSNMEEYGSERSVRQLFHYWFSDGTVYDNARRSPIGPPPGYVVGGPNGNYSGSVSPPAGQPVQKSYRDWNTENAASRSWEISEPAIYYQAAYIRLLSSVIGEYRRR